MLSLHHGSVALRPNGSTPEMRDALVQELRGKTICGVKIHDAKAELSEGSDFEPCVAVRVLLDDPDSELESWPGTTIIAIQRETWQIAETLGFSEWAYIRNYVALKEAYLVGWTLPIQEDNR